MFHDRIQEIDSKMGVGFELFEIRRFQYRLPSIPPMQIIEAGEQENVSSSSDQLNFRARQPLEKFLFRFALIPAGLLMSCAVGADI